MIEIKKANQLLRKLNSDTLPVNLEDIASIAGIQRVSSRELEPEIRSILAIRTGAGAIAYNNAHTIPRHRFAIAHAIGHYVLHRHLAKVFVDTLVTTSEDENEAAANRFAYAVLMPEKAVREYGHVDIHDTGVLQDMADTFGVSVPVLIFRLAGLKILL